MSSNAEYARLANTTQTLRSKPPHNFHIGVKSIVLLRHGAFFIHKIPPAPAEYKQGVAIPGLAGQKGQQPNQNHKEVNKNAGLVKNHTW